MWESISHDPGKYVADWIIDVAHLVANPSFPGYVSGGFLVALIFLISWFSLQTKRAINSVESAERIVGRATDRTTFREQFIEVDRALRAHEDPSARHSGRSISRGWHEFYETLVLPDTDDEQSFIRNTVRPHAFFNKDDLGFETGFWRQIPGFFVSIGLFFTFLGLIAVLQGAGDIFSVSNNVDIQRNAMKTLLVVASAKFIMSLTGLFCSIVFNFWHRVQNVQLDKAILGFCDALEFRMLFQTRESLAVEQLAVIKDQTTQLKAFNADLAAQVGHALEANTQALQKDLPDRITSSIETELRPILDEIKKQSTDNVDGMVRDLGSQLHDNLNASLTEIATTLGGVNSSLTGLARELGNSGTDISSEINGAVSSLSATMEVIRDNMAATSSSAAEAMQEGSSKVLEAMNQTLSAIENNTKESAGALSQAAKELVVAADNMGNQVRDTAIAAGEEARQGIEKAGQSVSDEMSETTAQFLEDAGRFKDAIDQTVGEAMAGLAVAMNNLDSQLQSSASHIDAHGKAVDGAASATSSANEALTESSQQLINAAEPIRTSVQNIEATNRRVVQALSESADAITASRDAVAQSMSALERAVEKFNEVADKYDDIDDKLGAAFGTIHHEVETAANHVRQYAEDVEKQFAKGINSLASVIDGLADFAPPHH